MSRYRAFLPVAVEQVLGEAQRKATAFVACFETRQDLEGYEPAQVCAREVDLEYLVVP